MSLDQYASDVLVLVAKKWSKEQRFVHERSCNSMHHVIQSIGDEVDFTTGFKLVRQMTQDGHGNNEILNTLHRLWKIINQPNQKIQFRYSLHDLRIIALCSIAIHPQTLNVHHLWETENMEPTVELPAVLAVYFENHSYLQSQHSTLVLSTIRNAIVKFDKHELVPYLMFKNEAKEKVYQCLLDILKTCSITFVHEFIKRYGSEIQNAPIAQKLLFWGSSFRMDVDTFKVFDELANFPVFSAQTIIHSIAKMSELVFEHVRKRMDIALIQVPIQVLNEIIHEAVYTDNTKILEWIYTKHISIREEIPYKYMLRRCLFSGKLTSVKWLMGKIGNPLPLNTFANHIAYMLHGKLTLQQMKEYLYEIHHTHLEDILKACIFQWPCTNSANVLFARLASNEHNFALLKLLHQCNQITPANDTKSVLTRFAALYGNIELLRWLIENGYTFDWKLMGAAVYSLDVQQIKFIDQAYMKSAKFNNPKIMMLAAKRGNVDVLHYLYESGYAVNIEDTFLEAVCSGNISASRYVFQRHVHYFGHEDESLGTLTRALALSQMNRDKSHFQWLCHWLKQDVVPLHVQNNFGTASQLAMTMHLMMYKCTERPNYVCDLYNLSTDVSRRSVFDIFDPWITGESLSMFYKHNWIAEIMGPQAAEAIATWYKP